MAREMIHSGIEWIGEIPKEWRVELIGNNIKEIKDKNEDSSEDNALQFKMGTIISKRGGDSKYNPESLAAYTMVQEGDIVINGLNLSFDFISQRVGLVREKGVITSTYLTLRPSSLLYSDFVNYLFKAYDNCKAFHGMGRGLRQILSYRELRNQKLIYPSLAEQQKIANYLDKVCREVDEMIALQEQMIEELKAYKQSVISEAVTKGLNPDVPMCDSGIDWIGEIPEHWKAEKLKYLISKIESGVSVNAGNVPAKESEIGVLKTSCVSKYIFDVNENKTVYSNEIDRVACPVRANTIIVSRMNTPELVGACGYVSDDCDNIYLPDRLWQVHFYDDVCVKYIWFVMRSSFIRNYYSSLSVGSSSSMQNISQDQFANAIIVLPPLNEQQSIASYLDTKCAEIDALIAIKQAKIEELKDYKKSVIYEYVTGKKEVV